MIQNAPSDVPNSLLLRSIPKNPGLHGWLHDAWGPSHGRCTQSDWTAVPWNVCGLSESNWPAFDSNFSCEVAPWDAILLQESNSLPLESSRTLPGGHFLFLSSCSEVFRSTGILLHARCSHVCEYFRRVWQKGQKHGATYRKV